MKTVIVISGPGPSKVKRTSAAALRSAQPDSDVLNCSTTEGIRIALSSYGSEWLTRPLLFYVLPAYPEDAAGWSERFLRAAEREISARRLSVRPTEAKVTAVQKDRGFYVKCPFIAAPAESVVAYAAALDVAFAQTDWRPKEEKKWWQIWR